MQTKITAIHGSVMKNNRAFEGHEDGFGVCFQRAGMVGNFVSGKTTANIWGGFPRYTETTADTVDHFYMDSDMLSKHVMMIGSTGCGKTNTFFHLVDQLKEKLTDKDVMIVFDTKADYKNEFFDSERDLVLCANEKEGNCIWNLFREILVDGFEEEKIADNVREICLCLFEDAVQKNHSNPFFPNAARNVFASVLNAMVGRGLNRKEGKVSALLHNHTLSSFCQRLTPGRLKQMIECEKNKEAVMTYIGDGKNNQGLGVLAELQTIAQKIFVAAFEKVGDFSIREFVRQRGGRTLFIEYDMARGATLTPVYSLLIDLALKEAMSDTVKGKPPEERGNVYIFCDEFKLLPHLQHIEDAVNFGRSLGVKVFAGLQSIDQLEENYGSARSHNILAGFSSVFSFRANDEQTRRFTVGKYGKNYVQERIDTQRDPFSLREGNVVEDWDVCALDTGEAIVGLQGHAPFAFRFEKYESRKG